MVYINRSVITFLAEKKFQDKFIIIVLIVLTSGQLQDAYNHHQIHYLVNIFVAANNKGSI